MTGTAVPVAGLDASAAGRQFFEGPAGPMEVWIDLPRTPRVGTAVIAHPHPLVGGSASHKIPQFLARGLADQGWLTLRPNFRGVGESAGVHDEGLGETEDLLALVEHVRRDQDAGPLALLGFSFGAYVQARVARALAEAGHAASSVALLGLPYGEAAGGRRYDPPRSIAHALVVHGEVDDRASLAGVLEWARPDGQPVVVVPGADHFFTGRLALLRSLVMAHVQRHASTANTTST